MSAREFVEGSGNVFADAGLENSDELMVKARIMAEIARLIEERGLTQTKAARGPGTRQPHVPPLPRPCRPRSALGPNPTATAIDRDHLTRDPGTLPSEQESRRRRNILGFAKPRNGMQLRDPLRQRRAVRDRR